ncbi:hypothetical protein [Streptomyces sp. 6-11-2]|uniref:hypothetical protein n=1 Tax=Streptomyces sp. 6-11-2 TaxID=2585753 RepID=UPI00114401FB|nr:hypothetical protein [Streptomyces sp. 6-11-2]GED83203.1 hypothetical protein TNCT6_02880 [Streptomyces sp. 6-11-2]
MGWTFKLHGGVAAGLGATLLLLATLTWLPGALPFTGARWLAAAIFVSLFLTFASALVRLIMRSADKHAIWMAFRCLPGKVQMALGALALWGVVLLVFSTATEGNLQSAEVRDGRYVAFDTTPHARDTVEISQSRYQDVLESDQRTMLAIPGVLFLGAAYAVLAAGELRRADGAVVPSGVT